MRIFHTSDLHLGYDNPYLPKEDRSSLLLAVLRTAERYHADILLIAGDLFDSCRVPDDLVERVVSCFRLATVPTVVLPGNHDCLVDESVYLRDSFSSLTPKVTVMTEHKGQTIEYPALDLSIWGRPHVDYNDFPPLSGLPQRGTLKWQVAVAHGHYTVDASLPHGWRITDADLASCNMDYVALGHVEKFSLVGSDGVPAYYSGSPQLTGAVALAELGPGSVRVRQVPLTRQ